MAAPIMPKSTHVTWAHSTIVAKYVLADTLISISRKWRTIIYDYDYYTFDFHFEFSFCRRQTTRRHMRQQCCWVVRQATVAQNDRMDIRRAHRVHIRIQIKRSTVHRKDHTDSHNTRQVRNLHREAKSIDLTIFGNNFLQPTGANFCHHHQSIHHHCHWVIAVNLHWDCAMCQIVLAQFDVQQLRNGLAPVYRIIQSKFWENACGA